MTESDDQQVPITVTAFEIVDGVEVPIGEPRERTTSRGALDLLHGTDPITDRRQRAREAAYDNPSVSAAAERSATVSAMLDDAVEAATRVKLTYDIVNAAIAADAPYMMGADIDEVLTAAFRAAGFEVEE
jgi:hypothetical protein